MQLIGDVGVTGEKRFLIAAQWWRKWCDYVNYQANHDDSIDDLNYEKPGVITNKLLVDDN